MEVMLIASNKMSCTEVFFDKKKTSVHDGSRVLRSICTPRDSKDMTHKDLAVRAMTDDGSFRVIAIRTTRTVQDALEIQAQLSSKDASMYGELLTGAVLVRQTMAPQHRVQVILKEHASQGKQMVADSFPEGLTRGIVQGGTLDTDFERGAHNVLQVMRVLFNNELQQGIVNTPEEGGLSQALTDYMLTSEQVATVIDVATVHDGSGVLASAGFIVQMLPEAKEETIAALLERLEERAPLLETLQANPGLEPEALIADLLGELEYTLLGEEDVFFGCTCSELKLVSAMATLGKDEIARIISSGEVVDVTCDYCRTPYRLGAEQLKPLLQTQ